MTASLFLPRLATAALVFVAVVAVAAVNAAALAGAELGPGWDALHRFAPPIGSALGLSVAAWLGRELPVAPALVVARLALWAILAPALLVLVFSRLDLGRRA